MKNLKIFILSLFFSLTAPGLDQAYLQELVSLAEAKKSHSLLIVQNDKILVEKYFEEPNGLIPVQSVTKSVSSLVIGKILEVYPQFSLATPLSTWFPEWKADKVKSKITLFMVLNHTTGIVDPEDLWDYDDTVKFILTSKVTHAPGTVYSYSSGVTSLLAPIVKKVTGQEIDQYADQILFRPLGIKEFKWNRDRGGNVASAGGLWLRPRDLLKIAQLMLYQGRWQGRQVIPAKWCQLSVMSSQNGFPEYGLQWWLFAPIAGTHNYRIFSALGHSGQWAIVYPEKSIIIVRTRTQVNNETAQEYNDRYFDELPLAPLRLENSSDLSIIK